MPFLVLHSIKSDIPAFTKIASRDENQTVCFERDWRTCAERHQRQCLYSEGVYLDGSGYETGHLHFWGEWEARAKIIETAAAASPLCVPLPSLETEKTWIASYESNASQDKRHNTDPIILGSQFFYANCSQNTSREFLRNIPEDSIILFGERVDLTRFRLSLLIVVDEALRYRPEQLAELYRRSGPGQRHVDNHGIFIPKSLIELSTLPLHYYDNRYRTMGFTMYLGRRYRDSNNFFSLFPCSKRYFEMPVIDLPKGIPLQQEDKIIYTEMSLKGLRHTWKIITEQIVGLDLKIGISARPPQ